MDTLKMTAIVLIVVGTMGLLYGGFTYPRQVEQAHLGSISLTVSDKRTHNVPIWVGVGTLALGGMLLVMAKARRGR